ncbi:TauD/TfdA dioxygenase family protein [Piscinibacter sakaiensis]|uniref:TauD/TfdA dioxygenase family protein n=1 Tax=Piscinibacter sakaiensis TaxID=1547922 RepID=UPI003AAF89B5
MKVTPTQQILGARIDGIDLGRPLAEEDRDQLIHWLGEYGVLHMPNQDLTARQLRDFSANFGQLEVNVANTEQEPGLPEVMTLSNIVENGKPIGLADAGQDWHTDMSYSRMIAFTNVLYGIEIPVRDGVALGCTEFCNMHAAYEGLPDEMKQRLEGKTASHDFAKFWDMMRREKGSKRPPLTPEQRAARPPVSHPVFMTHPITGGKVLYCNPGYAMRIDGMDERESDETLAFLFRHQLQDEYRYRFSWTPNTVLMWDNMGTIHNAVADYRADERRLIKRCQVAATRFFAAA